MAGTVTSVEGAQPSYTIAKASFLLGVALIVSANLFYALNYERFYNYFAPPFYSYVSLILVTLASLSFGVSAFSYFSIQQRILPKSDGSVLLWSMERIISDAVFQQKKIFVIATVIYGFVFSLLDGILVYQPNVDFYVNYFVNGPTWRVVTCCGSPGYVPLGLFYLPAQHIGVELYPLSFLLLLIVSILVGLNVSLLVKAFRASRISANRAEKKGIAGTILGATVGLFAGCPTCAAAFFLSMIAGTGATAFSAIIAAYQPLIVALTIPLLIFSVMWQARSIRMIFKGCEPNVDAK
ncbi:MAG: hypothetical protein JRN20_05720 [Nitrososphaerota archaeon]|nr:hypothetical protein [Nitrososphaerota archaeon]MDG6922090.1 hypothetical protein [Nitrososphaerota archaeon]